MESSGTRLKKLRLQKGLSLEEVNKKTKIHLNILKAIEEDSLTNISPVYIKGFLKIYCQFLEVNPEDYIKDYKEPQGAQVIVSAVREKHAVFFKTALIRLGYFATKIINKVSITVLILIFLSISLFKLGKVIASRRSSLSRKSTLAVLAPNKTQKKAPVAKSEKIESVTVVPKPLPSLVKPQKEVTSGIRLVIQAKENCWIQLKTDGRVVFQNILRKGRFESWQAKDKIEFSLGNAGAVVLEVNGKVIPSLGRKGQALKNILITKEGLSVPR